MGQVRYGQKNVARPREKNDFEKVFYQVDLSFQIGFDLVELYMYIH